jgi:hypothetical protein
MPDMITVRRQEKDMYRQGQRKKERKREKEEKKTQIWHHGRDGQIENVGFLLKTYKCNLSFFDLEH